MKRIFIDGLSGMAQGLFATLIIGTIIQQIGLFVGGDYGNLIYMIGKVAAGLTGAGIGVGVARKLEAQQLVTVSAAVAGMIGAFASKLLAGQLIVDGNLVLAGPGEPLGAFIAAYLAIEIGILVTGKTKLDIILTPLVCIGTGSVVGLVAGPPISKFMAWLGSLINWGTEQQPFLMGIVVSVLMGIFLTLPISSAAIGVILNLSGLALRSCQSRGPPDLLTPVSRDVREGLSISPKTKVSSLPLIFLVHRHGPGHLAGSRC